MIFPRIFNLEKEPLGMSISIYIILHKQIILTVIHFLSQIEIAWLKATFEQQCLISSIDWPILF